MVGEIPTKNQNIMCNIARTKFLINQLVKQDKHVNAANIFTQSLFSTGGTLTIDEASEALDTIEDRLDAKVSKNYEGGISGFADALARLQLKGELNL